MFLQWKCEKDYKFMGFQFLKMMEMGKLSYFYPTFYRGKSSFLRKKPNFTEIKYFLQWIKNIKNYDFFGFFALPIFFLASNSYLSLHYVQLLCTI